MANLVFQSDKVKLATLNDITLNIDDKHGGVNNASVYYISDTHIEHLDTLPQLNAYIQHLFPPHVYPDLTEEQHIYRKGDILILAGDICSIIHYNKPHKGMDWRLRKFLDVCSNKFRAVLYLPGNHEYYTPTHIHNGDYNISMLDAMLDSCILEYWNVYNLQRESIEIGGYRFVGTTLWSYIDQELDDPGHIQQTINDYCMIDEFTIEYNNQLHSLSLTYLENILTGENNNPNIPTIVITHHTPRRRDTSPPEYANSLHIAAFSTDLPPSLLSAVKYWICGHTHHQVVLPNVDNTGCTIALNCAGYPNQQSFHAVTNDNTSMA